MTYFTFSEFDSPDQPGSGKNMDATLLQMLDLARELYGKPMIVNSGFRTEDHNIKVGGTAKSSHLNGLAADIRCLNSSDRFAMLEAFKQVGFNRLGIAATFIHVDTDTTKPPNLIWTY